MLRLRKSYITLDQCYCDFERNWDVWFVIVDWWVGGGVWRGGGGNHDSQQELDHCVILSQDSCFQVTQLPMFASVCTRQKQLSKAWLTYVVANLDIT